MKISGIVRKVDPLGRIVIPAELRKVLEIKDGDTLEILQEGKDVVLRKYHVSCVFCGEEENLYEYKGMLVCNGCKNGIGKVN